MNDVLIAGCNPCIFLYDKSATHITFALSFWEANYSVAGSGRCLFLRSQHPEIPKSLICFDNPSLADLVHANFNKHFVGFKDGMDTFVVREPASFVSGAVAGENKFRLDVRTESIIVVAAWEELGAAEQIIADLGGFGPRGADHFRVSSVIVPAGGTTVYINGRAVEGRVTESYGSLKSSAFLAWAESWSRISPNRS